MHRKILFTLLTFCYITSNALTPYGNTTQDIDGNELPIFFVNINPPGDLYFINLGVKHLQGVTPVGLTFGFNFRYDPHFFISLEGTGKEASPIFADNDPAIYEKDCLQVSIREHYILGRFDFGVGAYAGRYHGYSDIETNISNNTYVNTEYNNESFGGSFSICAHMARSLCLGITYNPQILSLQNGSTQTNYAHAICFGIVYRSYPRHNGHR